MKKIHLPAGTEHVQFGELAQLIADALRPLGDDATDSEMMAHGGTRINLEAELNQAVKDGTLPVKDPLTFGPHTFPVGDALRRSLVTVGDLRAFLAGRPVTLEIAPEQAATPEAATDADLMTYRAREQFTLFELACLLHRADPEKVHNDTWDGWRERKRQLGFERAEMTPALFIGELSLMPELLAGPLIGGTIKQLKKAIGCATILHSIEGNQARTLADCLGLTFPPELSAAQAQQAPEPQAAPVVAESASGGEAIQPPDPERRLARLRAGGGSVKYRNGEWKFTGIAALVASEKAEGRKRRDEKTIRADLKEAAEAERDAKRAGPFQGLGA